MKTNKGQRTIFLDRDGTLIEEVNFLHRIEELRFFSYTDEAIKLLKRNGFRVVVVTNQSGIGRGIYTVEEMHAIHAQIQKDLTEKIDGFYFCPHLPDAGCACRKPNIGMIEQAKDDFEIDFSDSWVIGDKVLDIELGFNAGIKSALVRTGYGQKSVAALKRKPDLIVENLLEAALQIINRPSEN
jgi:D-glycero-D-manno-heptose 1,7-bisphosphate phosphatase